jgi:hypothetical protein
VPPDAAVRPDAGSAKRRGGASRSGSAKPKAAAERPGRAKSRNQ